MKFIATYLILLLTLQAHAQRDTAPSVLMDDVSVRGAARRPVVRGLERGVVHLAPAALQPLPSLMGSSDLLKLLELTPSVQNAGEANTNMYVRGGEAGHNLMLYGGAPLYLPGHLAGFFPLFNADHISSLELSKSGMHARYGGRLSAAVDVQGRAELPAQASLTGSVGLLASQATVATPLGRRWGLYLSGRASYLGAVVQPLMSAMLSPKERERLSGMGYDLYDGNLTLVGELSRRSTLRVDAFGSRDALGVQEDLLRLDGALAWSSALLSVQWDVRAGGCRLHQQLYGSAYRNRLSMRQMELDVGMASGVRDLGYKGSAAFLLGGVPLEAGLQYAHHRLAPQAFDIVNADYGYDLGRPAPQQAHDAALYLAATLPLSEKLSAEAGLRGNLFSSGKTFGSLDPRLSLRYALSESAGLRAAFSRQHQYLRLVSPSAVGMPTDFWVAASREVRPQSGGELSVGGYRSLRGGAFELSLEAYYRSMSGLSEYLQNFLNSQTNAYAEGLLYGSGRACGLELMAKKNAGKLTGWLSYALGHSERRFDGVNGGRAFPSRGDRRHDLSLVASYAHSERWTFSVVYAYATGAAYTLPSSWYFVNGTPVREYGDYNAARMPAYNRTDLSATCKLSKNHSFNFSVYNVLMVTNPIYVFLHVGYSEEKANAALEVKQKSLYSIMPSVSWRFKF